MRLATVPKLAANRLSVHMCVWPMKVTLAIPEVTVPATMSPATVPKLATNRLSVHVSVWPMKVTLTMPEVALPAEV